MILVIFTALILLWPGDAGSRPAPPEAPASAFVSRFSPDPAPFGPPVVDRVPSDRAWANLVSGNLVPANLVFGNLVSGNLVAGGPTPAGLGVGGSLRDDVRERIRTTVEMRHRVPGGLRAGGDPIRAESTLVRFYVDRAYRPAWSSDDLLPQADTLLAILRRADRHGLTPSDYHTAAVDSLVAALRALQLDARRSDAALLAELDLALTDAFLLHGTHLLRGRVDPLTVVPEWTAPPRAADLVTALNDAISTGDVTAAMDALAPQDPAYAALMRAYARYRRIATTGGWPTLPDGDALEPGTPDRRVPILRARLLATLDLDPGSPPARDSLGAVTYDSVLVDAVRAFQRRHGLTDDGVIGAKTQQALAVPATERVRQLRVALERMRWLPTDLGRRHVRVNIAGYDLRLVDDGATTLQMRVVTGTPYRQTPSFSDAIRYLVLSPFWHVPVKLAVEDKLPAIREDPSYFRQQQIRVYDGYGADAREVNPDSVDWSAVSPERFPFRLRQDPGAYNALGRIKFMFPNPHDVYLHDTPTRGLFARDQRAFSSGCIRLEQPLELAAALLDGQTSQGEPWTLDRLRETLDRAAPRTVWLKTPVPVHLLYWTAWVDAATQPAADAADTVQFRPDVYARDAALADALDAPPTR